MMKSKILEKEHRNSVDSSSSSSFGQRNVKFDNDSSASSSTTSINYDRYGTSFDLKKSKLEARKVQSAFEMNASEKKAQRQINQRNSIAVGKTKEPSIIKNQTKFEKLKKRSPVEIEILKQKDPIFAKRYKQFINAKICNKAPKFDYNDNNVKIVPESKLKRNWSDIINKNKSEESEEPLLLKAEMEKIDHRVKQFIKNFSNNTF